MERRTPPSAVEGWLDALRAIPGPLAAALRGEPLGVRVVATDAGTEHDVAITRDGNVASPPGAGFSPDVQLRGTDAELAELLGGAADLAEAARTGAAVDLRGGLARLAAVLDETGRA